MPDNYQRPVEGPEWANTTSTQMLAGARSGDPESWQDLVRLYAPLVLSWCRRRGLCGPRRQDAEDVVQHVFKTVWESIATFSKDEKPAAFRRWLYTIFDFKMREYWRRRNPNVSLDSSALGRVPAPDDPPEPAAISDRILLLRRLLELIRREFEPRTWDAFWRVAAEGRCVKDVAKELGMSDGAVYVAKSRVLTRLRKEAEALEFDLPNERR